MWFSITTNETKKTLKIKNLKPKTNKKTYLQNEKLQRKIHNTKHTHKQLFPNRELVNML